MLWRTSVMILITMTLAFSCQGQRTGGGVHGGGMSGSGHRPTSGVPEGLPNTSHGNFRFRHFRNFAGYGAIPWVYPWDCWDWSLDGNWCASSPRPTESYAESPQNGGGAPIMIEANAPTKPAQPLEPPKIIEVSTGKEVTQSHSSPPSLPTLFVLANGKRLKARRYMLTADFADIEVGGEHRRFAMNQLNTQQTIAANRKRGIEIII